MSATHLQVAALGQPQAGPEKRKGPGLSEPPHRPPEGRDGRIEAPRAGGGADGILLRGGMCYAPANPEFSAGSVVRMTPSRRMSDRKKTRTRHRHNVEDRAGSPR